MQVFLQFSDTESKKKSCIAVSLMKFTTKFSKRHVNTACKVQLGAQASLHPSCEPAKLKLRRMSVGQRLGSALSYQRRWGAAAWKIVVLCVGSPACQMRIVFLSTPDTEDPQRESDDGEMQVLQA